MNGSPGLLKLGVAVGILEPKTFIAKIGTASNKPRYLVTLVVQITFQGNLQEEELL